MEREQAIKLMQDLLKRVVDRKGSDLFITAGFPPAIKVDGEIRPQSERVLTPEQAAVLVRSIMNDKQTRDFDSSKECNFAIAPAGIGRFRVSAFVQQGQGLAQNALQDFNLFAANALQQGQALQNQQQSQALNFLLGAQGNQLGAAQGLGQIGALDARAGDRDLLERSRLVLLGEGTGCRKCGNGARACAQDQPDGRPQFCVRVHVNPLMQSSSEMNRISPQNGSCIFETTWTALYHPIRPG